MYNEPNFYHCTCELAKWFFKNQNPYNPTACKCIQRGESKATKVVLQPKKTKMQESLGWHISVGDGKKRGMHRLLGPM
jgi:hypothetical protein